MPFSGTPFLVLSRPSASIYTPPSRPRVLSSVWSLLAVFFDGESNNLYASSPLPSLPPPPAVVFNLHLNWLLMAFCRLDGSRTERKEKESPSPVHTGNSQILKRPRERVAELSCRVQCTGAGAFLPDTREERAGPSREKGRQRKVEKERMKEGERSRRELGPRCFSCSPIRYINIPNRDSRRYTVERASARTWVVLLVRPLPRRERFRKFARATPPRFVSDKIIPPTITGVQARRKIDQSSEETFACSRKWIREKMEYFLHIFLHVYATIFFIFFSYLDAYNFISTFFAQ